LAACDVLVLSSSSQHCWKCSWLLKRRDKESCASLPLLAAAPEANALADVDIKSQQLATSVKQTAYNRLFGAFLLFLHGL
jgi:hypothetical protein